MSFISDIERRRIERARRAGREAGMQEGLRLGALFEKRKMLKIARWMRATGSKRATIQRLTEVTDFELDKLC
jgi:predicted transposase YdaD